MQQQQIVRTLAGRDKGRLFLVWDQAEEDYFLLCDGGLRSSARPKRKKHKHCKLVATVESALAAREMSDAQIRSLLSQAAQEQLSK